MLWLEESMESLEILSSVCQPAYLCCGKGQVTFSKRLVQFSLTIAVILSSDTIIKILRHMQRETFSD